MKAVTAKKNHGKCDCCPADIKAGEQYVRVLRHASEKERNNPRVKTVSMWGRGPHVSVKRHVKCNDEAYAEIKRPKTHWSASSWPWYILSWRSAAVSKEEMVYDETHNGDCFTVAAGFLTSGMVEAIHRENRQPITYGEKSPWRIVHGLPIGTGGKVEGKRYWHAWIEFTSVQHGVIVLVRSNGHSKNIPADVYYRAGQLTEEFIWRFTLDEAKKKMRKLHHCGPWVPGWQTMEDPSLHTTTTSA